MVNKSRIVYIDIIRVVACAMVILMHTPHPEAGVPGFIQVPIYFLTAGGLVLFFMVSGALLLPTKMSTQQFLKRRIGKIAGPWLFWTLFYMAINISQKGLSSSVVDELFVYVSSPGRHVMWFMFVLLALYLITPILSFFVQNATKNEIIFYLFLWCITLILPWLSPYTALNLEISSPLYYFSGYVGYFLLGYYLHTYRPNIVKYAILLIALPLVAKLIYSMMDGQRSDELFWYLSIPVMLLSVAYFTIFQKAFDGKEMPVLVRVSGGGELLERFSNCSFGIYLIHIFIMRNLLWKVDFIVYGLGWIGQMVMTWTLTFLISFAITWAISYIPYSEYIIGYSSRKKI